MRNKYSGMRVIYPCVLVIWVLLAATTTKADPIILNTTSQIVTPGFPPTLTSISFTGAPRNTKFELTCLCPSKSPLGESITNGDGAGSLTGFEDATTGQTSFYLQIGNLFYGRFWHFCHQLASDRAAYSSRLRP